MVDPTDTRTETATQLHKLSDLQDPRTLTMPKQTKRIAKKTELMQVIASHLDSGTFYLAEHADERKSQRNVTQMEVEYVLRNGWWVNTPRDI